MTTVETIKIDLDNITCSGAWNLVRAYENKEIKLDLSQLLSNKFADILIKAPENVVTETVNGIQIEITDCYKKHFLRIPQLGVVEWICHMNINNWNCDLSWAPDYINFVVNNTCYTIHTETLQIYKLITNDSIQL
jgi:hypothetical protein